MTVHATVSTVHACLLTQWSIPSSSYSWTPGEGRWESEFLHVPHLHVQQAASALLVNSMRSPVYACAVHATALACRCVLISLCAVCLMSGPLKLLADTVGNTWRRCD